MIDFDKPYKGNDFKVPEQYFETLEERVVEKLYTKTRFKVDINRIIAIAASIIIVIGIGVLSYNSNTNDSESITFNDLDSSDIAAFENSVEFSDEDIEELVSDYTIDSLYRADVKFEPVSNQLNNQDISELEEEFEILDSDIDI